MRAGLLTEEISFTEAIITKNAYGASETEWNTVFTTRAKVIYQSGSRAVENNEIVNIYLLSFIIRIYHQINEKMIIIYNSNKYRILSIEKNKITQSLTINAELINE